MEMFEINVLYRNCELIEIEKTEFMHYHKYKNPNKKTYDIYITTPYNEVLAKIKWWGAWRKYVLETFNIGDDGVIFDTKCLKDVISYIDKLMEERKVKRSETNE